MPSENDHSSLEALTQRIMLAESSIKQKDETASAETTQRNRNLIRVVRLGSDFIALIVGGGIVGWFLDTQLNTTPWVMIASIVLGFAAGFWLIVKATSSDKTDDATPPER